MFSVRVIQALVHDNHMPKPFLAGQPPVDVKFFSIVSTNNQSIKGIDQVLGARDPASLQVAVAGALSATIQTMPVPALHSKIEIPLGGTAGWEVYQNETEPESIEWILGVMKASTAAPGAETTGLVNSLMSDPRIATLSGIASLVVPGVAPVVAASTKILQTIGEIFNAMPVAQAGGDLLGVLHLSLNKEMHYPTGFSAPINVPDPTRNLLLDYLVQFVPTAAPVPQ